MGKHFLLSNCADFRNCFIAVVIDGNPLMNNHLDMNSFLTAYAYKIINEYLPAGPRVAAFIVYSNRQQDNIMIYLHCFEHTALKRQMIGMGTVTWPLLLIMLDGGIFTS